MKTTREMPGGKFVGWQVVVKIQLFFSDILIVLTKAEF